MDPEFGRHYARLYREHWWWRARERLLLNTVAALAPAGGYGPILDVGCGDGLFFHALGRFGAVEGVEPDVSLVTPGGPHRDRIHAAPFDERLSLSKQYGLVLMLDVLEHLPNPVASLRHALTVLRPGGVFLATVPAFRALWTGHDDFNHHTTRHTRSTFRVLADAAGLRVDAMRYFFHWTAPVKLLVRLKEALVRTPPLPERVPPAAINRLLLGLSIAEQAVLGPLHLPFGTSLLVVGGRSADNSTGRRP